MSASKAEQKKFFAEVEDLVWAHDISFTEAVVRHCEARGLDPLGVAKLVCRKLKAILAEEATKLNLLKRKKSK